LLLFEGGNVGRSITKGLKSQNHQSIGAEIVGLNSAKSGFWFRHIRERE
jgi:hypothetical protein